MKQNLRFFMLALLCAVFGSAWGTDETITFSEQGYSNQQEITIITGTNFTITFNKGSNSNAPKYFTSGTAIRAYGGNNFTVSSSSTITNIVITFGSSDGNNDITADNGTYSNGTWTGSANDVTFTIGGTSGNRRLAAITVTTGGGTNPPTTYTVTYDCNGGTSGCPSNQNGVTAGTIITIADEPTRTDYTFGGWNDGTSLYDAGDEYTVNDNVTFTAQWTESTTPQPSSNTYALFSGNLEEGDYIIVYNNGAMNNTVSSNRFGITDVTPQNDIITTSDQSIVWHIAPSGNYWTIQSLAGNNKYAAGTGIKNQIQLLDGGTDDMALWTASGNSTYEFVNKKNAANDVNSNLRRNGSYGFACYATGTGGALSLYKSQNTSNVATPVILPNGGEFTGTQEVTISCETEGATIYYTLNGDAPTAQSTQYNAPFTISSSCTVKAIAINGNDQSAIATATFTRVKYNPELAFSEENVTAYYGQDFTPPTLTYADGYDGTITYSSSNSAITVDPATGEISFGTDAIDKTTTITATATETDNYSSSTATYTLTVRDPNAITGNLNNTTFGTNYDGSVSAGFTSATGTISDIVTVTYNRGTSNTAYINDSEIRLYNGNTLVFEVPDGYLIQSLTFNTSLAAEPNTGTLDGATWTSEEGVQSVSFSGTGTTRNLSSVTIHLSQASSTVAKPIISPATGTYTEAQTVTITSQEEGATIYYTTDGSTPTTSSTVYKKSFELSKNGTYTIKAIAVKDNEVSLTSTSTITIAIHVDPPVFTETSGTTFTEPYAIHLTATDGLSIYYATGSDSPIDEDGNLSGKAIAYNDGINNLSKATTITAVAIDASGNLSETVTATYNYSGTVNAPYYENFDQGLGNFTVETEGSNPPVWTFRENASQADIERYGEARRYAYVNGSSKSGTARLISPMIDLTDETITTATLNFIHAGRYFDGYNQDNLTVEQTAGGEAPSHAQLFVREEGGDWTQVTIPNWFTQSSQYTRFNSGDIDLSDYAGKKIQISFLYTADTESTGIWNVLKFALTTTETEVVNMKTDGYVTYVVKNDIDWEQTLARNNSDGSVNVHGYKVIEFSKETAVFAEFGVGENEKIIPAETPIIMKGTQGDNHLVIAKTEDVIAKPKNNLLKPSYGDVKATEDQRLLVFQKSADWTADDPYNNYGFFKLATGRTIPERKSYLNGTEVSETITNTTNAAKGIFLLEDLGNSELTAISSPDAPATTWLMQGAIYDLSGRKVADSLPQAGQLSKGIYIVNGRKIVIK